VSSASVVIDNHNYERFVASAIESALDQTHPTCEVVVVDDGSTDGSREVIDRYRDRVRVVYKENGGQASAVNAGFDACHGEVVCFLDADDVLEPGAMEVADDALAAPGTSHVHWPLWHLDARGGRSGGIEPHDPLPSGDLAATTLRLGPLTHVSSPMSGNAYARSSLERVLPMPEEEFRLYADAYLIALAPLYGTVASVSEPHGGYRLHGAGNFAGTPFGERVRRGVAMTEALWAIFGEHARRLSRDTDARGWYEHSWWHRLARLLEDVPVVVDRDDPPADFVLIDDDVLGLTWGCERAHPFIERDGIYWGPAADDATAVAELRRMREAGARYVVVIWSSFWWLDHYPALKAELDAAAMPLLDDERVKVFAFENGARA
jgi:glycosyltransferase involved in cell wall biosynthesis